MALTVAVGLTVMVKVLSGPVQVLALGVTVTVPLIGAVVELVAVKEAILPEPLPANPMFVLPLTHAKPVPATGPVKVTGADEAPLQRVWFAIASTVGVGLTVMIKVMGVPVHPLAVGVTVRVPLMGADVALDVVNAAMLPLPLVARPMAPLLFVQL